MALGILVLIGTIYLTVQIDPNVRQVDTFVEKFKKIQHGDPESKVITILGKPETKESEFRLGQKEGFEESYERAKSSDSQYYLLWHRGIDVVFTIGINNKGLVSVKEHGGT